jgi:hypothetical protein
VLSSAAEGAKKEQKTEQKKDPALFLAWPDHGTRASQADSWESEDFNALAREKGNQSERLSSFSPFFTSKFCEALNQFRLLKFFSDNQSLCPR